MGEFRGFTLDTYHFLTEIGFRNEKLFYEQNRERYKSSVLEPLKELAQTLLPDMLRVDPQINPKLSSIVSRIYRDTRFSKNKLPYRDHAWLSFRRPGNRLSESFTVYFEITPDSYGYGMGMYGANADMMRELRARVFAAPARFSGLINDRALDKYILEGEEYKRDRFPDADEALKPYLNRKGLSWCYSCPKLQNTFNGRALVDELIKAVSELGPLYRFVMGMER